MLQPKQILQERYQIQQQLGFNAVRQTWLAEDLTTSEQVVVKLLAFGGNVQWDELKLFEREAQILQQLDHERIPKYRDYFSIDDRFLWFGLVQDYIPGQSFKEVLNAGKRFTEDEIRNYGEELLKILTYLHSLNPPVLHRDIKPSNLILGEDDKVYLVDFGAVQDKAAAEGATFTVVGTYGYAPMEQFGGRTVPASDLYALGATLVHLITRTSPADLPTENLRMKFRDRISCSASFVHWLEKLTEPALEKRFQTASEALEALRRGENKNVSVTPNSHSLEDKLVLPGDSPLKITQTEKYFIVERRPRFYQLPLAKFKVFRVLSFLVGVASVFFIILSFGPLLLFIIPFLSPGIKTQIDARRKPLFRGTKLELYKNVFILQKQFLGFSYSKETGKTSDIQDVIINYEEVTSQGSSTYGTRDRTFISISGLSIITSLNQNSFRKYVFGIGLREVELKWVTQGLKDWLSSR